MHFIWLAIGFSKANNNTEHRHRHACAHTCGDVFREMDGRMDGWIIILAFALSNEQQSNKQTNTLGFFLLTLQISDFLPPEIYKQVGMYVYV